MKVRIKSIKEIRKIGIEIGPCFVTDDNFESIKFILHGHKHSMEYYCGKVIELDKNDRFDDWKWADWMYDKNTNPLLEVEE